jgi:hypothetical protein
MIARYNRWSFLFGVPGIVLQVAGVLVAESDAARPHPVGEPWVEWRPSLVSFGVLLWTAGLAAYAMAKGRASWWGLLGLLGLPGLYSPYLTFLSLVGLVVLVLLPDRSGGSAVAGEPGPPGR